MKNPGEIKVTFIEDNGNTISDIDLLLKKITDDIYTSDLEGRVKIRSPKGIKIISTSLKSSYINKRKLDDTEKYLNSLLDSQNEDTFISELLKLEEKSYSLKDLLSDSETCNRIIDKLIQKGFKKAVAIIASLGNELSDENKIKIKNSLLKQAKKPDDKKPEAGDGIPEDDMGDILTASIPSFEHDVLVEDVKLPDVADLGDLSLNPVTAAEGHVLEGLGSDKGLEESLDVRVTPDLMSPLEALREMTSLDATLPDEKHTRTSSRVEKDFTEAESTHSNVTPRDVILKSIQESAKKASDDLLKVDPSLEATESVVDKKSEKSSKKDSQDEKSRYSKKAKDSTATLTETQLSFINEAILIPKVNAIKEKLAQKNEQLLSILEDVINKLAGNLGVMGASELEDKIKEKEKLLVGAQDLLNEIDEFLKSAHPEIKAKVEPELKVIYEHAKAINDKSLRIRKSIRLLRRKLREVPETPSVFGEKTGKLKEGNSRYKKKDEAIKNTENEIEKATKAAKMLARDIKATKAQIEASDEAIKDRITSKKNIAKKLLKKVKKTVFSQKKKKSKKELLMEMRHKLTQKLASDEKKLISLNENIKDLKSKAVLLREKDLHARPHSLFSLLQKVSIGSDKVASEFSGVEPEVVSEFSGVEPEVASEFSGVEPEVGDVKMEKTSMKSKESDTRRVEKSFPRKRM